ncbi:hypothetical protein BJ508DRAFT_327130 [Ascobolus immersus RN42]|uniref:Uncharacterized protein n=1 Tax=Ascobolus immersus RN42 TaxID=1160509 RepID=A0A3N4I3K9_ASCIM|nr:hypothetical protein BJ508DRAFT_327130 [Ascobolus immersus RN42]
MAFLGMRIFAKKWPTPVSTFLRSLSDRELLLPSTVADLRIPARPTWMKPMAPFFIAGGVIFYGINSFANMMMLSAYLPSPASVRVGGTNNPDVGDEYKNDPRNPLTAGKH